MSLIQTWFDVRWLTVAVVALFVVLGLTHIPQEMMPDSLQVHLLDKVEHMVAYGTLALLFLLSFHRPPGVKMMLVILLAGAIVGTLDEMTQPWVNRIASSLDVVADLTGIVLACLLFLAIQFFRREQTRRSTSVSNP